MKKRNELTNNRLSLILPNDFEQNYSETYEWFDYSKRQYAELLIYIRSVLKIQTDYQLFKTPYADWQAKGPRSQNSQNSHDVAHRRTIHKEVFRLTQKARQTPQELKLLKIVPNMGTIMPLMPCGVYKPSKTVKTQCSPRIPGLGECHASKGLLEPQDAEEALS